MSNPFVKVREFVAEVATELKRSQWPTRKELVDSTLLVLVMMLVLGLFVSLVDLILVRIVQWLTGAA